MILEIIGYIASLIVLVSLLMSSIKKLRWINLIGALLFGIYGFLIGSIPTGAMNMGIVFIDAYYLVKMYQNKDFFKILQIDQNSEYLKSFFKFYDKDLSSFVDYEHVNVDEAAVKFYILRNMTPAGVFIADEYDKNTLEIKIDYVVPQYRDFKIGSFVYASQKEAFKNMSYTQLVVFTDHLEHKKYLKRMGFHIENLNGKEAYIKNI